MDYTKTELYKYLKYRRTELLERIEGCRAEEVEHWLKIWRSELAAVDRATWSLTNQA